MTQAITSITQLESSAADKFRELAGLSTTSSSDSGTSSTDELTALRQQRDEISTLKTKNEKTIEELEKEVDQLKKEIAQKLQEALNEGEAFTSEQEANVDNAISVTVAKYLKGEITKDELMDTLATELSSTNSEMGEKLKTLISGNDSIVSEIESKIGQICDLAKENEELEAKLKEVDTKIAQCEAEIQSRQGGGGCDPIGFEKDGISYDFIVDRNDNGVFDGANEFMGAENGFDEMKALDKDGNGVIEGNELSGVRMVKTNKKTGEQTFISAIEAGVTKLDLSTYQKTNYKDINGNDHIGKFNIEAQGSVIEGYQTLDSMAYLNANFGNSYGKTLTEGVNNGIPSAVATVASVSKNYTNVNAEYEKMLVELTEDKIERDFSYTEMENINSVTVSEMGLMSEEELQKQLDEEKGKKTEKTENNQDNSKKPQYTYMAYTAVAEQYKIKEKEEKVA